MNPAVFTSLTTRHSDSFPTQGSFPAACWGGGVGWALRLQGRGLLGSHLPPSPCFPTQAPADSPDVLWPEMPQYASNCLNIGQGGRGALPGCGQGPWAGLLSETAEQSPGAPSKCRRISGLSLKELDVATRSAATGENISGVCQSIDRWLGRLTLAAALRHGTADLLDHSS